MKSISAALVLSVVMATHPIQAQKNSRPPAQFTQRVEREVRHQILMLPYYDVFDVIGFQVTGYDVTLVGQVTRPSLKDDAEHAIKKIEGVERINNQIEVLPVSFNDDRIRRRMFQSIYGYPALQRYALPPIKPIRIIVNRGHVTLEGVVDTQGDKNLVNIRASGVSGVFSVTNHLAVESDAKRVK